MACTQKQREEEAFAEAKEIILGGDSSISMKGNDYFAFDHTRSKKYTNVVEALAVAKSKEQALAKWATEKYGATFSKGWLEIFPNGNLVEAKYAFPAKLKRAYAIRDAMDERDLEMKKYETDNLELKILEQIENPQGLTDMYGNTYGSIDEMVTFYIQELEDLRKNEYDDTLPGVSTLVDPNYIVYYDKRVDQLKNVNKTIARLYAEKRIETGNNKSVAKRISYLTTLKESIEKDIESYTNSSDKFSQIKNLISKDIALIKDLLTNPNLDNVFLAQDIYRFIATNIQIANSANKMFKKGSNEVFATEVEELLKETMKEITFIEGSIKNALDVEFTKLLETYSESLSISYPGKTIEEIKKELLSNLEDPSFMSSQFMSVGKSLTAETDILSKLLRLEYEKINEEEKSKSQKLIQAVDGALPTLEKELIKEGLVVKGKSLTFMSYTWLHQKDKQGEPLGKLVGKFSSDWKTFIGQLLRDSRLEVDNARQAKDWTKLNKALEDKYKALNSSTDFLDFGMIREITDLPEYAEFKKGTDSEAIAYKQKLIDQIGQEEFDDYMQKQKDNLDSFIEEKLNLIKLRLKQENVLSIDQLSPQVKDNLLWTIDRLNPAKLIESHLLGQGGMIEYTMGTQTDNKPSYVKYNMYIPKIKTTLGDDTGFYDKNFDKISKNPILYNFWKIAKQSHQLINENYIDSDLNLDRNSILLQEKSFKETLMDKTYLGIIKAGLGRYTNLKAFIKDQMSAKDIDSVDNQQVILPGGVATFSDAVASNHALIKTDIANLVGKQVTDKTIIVWTSLSPNAQDKILEMLGVDNSMDLLSDLQEPLGNFSVGKLVRYSKKKVFESQTLDYPKMLKAHLEVAAEHKSRTRSKNNIDLLIQQNRTVLTRKESRGVAEVENSMYWGKERVNANKRNEFFKRQVILNNKKDPTWGNISELLKTVSNVEDGKILGKIFYKNYTPEQKQVYASALLRLKRIEQELAFANEKYTEKLIAERNKLESRIRMLGKDYLGSAIYNSVFNKLAITIGLGYSLPAMLNNYTNGHVMLFARDGEYWPKGNINLTWHFVTQNKTRFFRPEYKKQWDTMGAFLKQLNIIQDGTNELQRAEDNVSFLEKSALHPLYGTELVEWYNQVPGILAMAMDVEVAPGVPLFNGKEFPAHHLVNGVFTLKDQYRTPENIRDFEEISSKKMIEWKLRVKEMTQSLNGDFSKSGVIMIKSSVQGKTVSQFKTWLGEFIYARYALKQKNALTGEEQSGFLIASLINPKTTVAGGLLTIGGLALGAMSVPATFFMLPFLGPIVGVGVVANLVRAKKLSMDLSEVSNIRNQVGYALEALTLGTLETPVNLIGGAFGIKNTMNIGTKFKSTLTPREATDLAVLAKTVQLSLLILLTRLAYQFLLGDDEEDEVRGEEGSAQRARWEKQQTEKAEGDSLYYFIENFFTARYQELNLATDPVALASTMGSRNGVESTLDKLVKTFLTIGKAMMTPEEDTITQGVDAGDSKVVKAVGKFIVPTSFRNIGKDDWKAGFEISSERDFQPGDMVNTIFDSDFKSDMKKYKTAKYNEKQELIKEFELENGVKVKDLEPEEAYQLNRKINKAAEKEVGKPKRGDYDENQNEYQE